MKTRGFLPLLLVLLFCSLSALAAQQLTDRSTTQNQASAKEQAKPQKDDDVVRISVTLVQVDAVVTDRQGKPVTDLKASDFEVYEDGRRQHISNFTFVRTQEEAPAAAPKTEPRSRTPAVPGPPTRLRPDQVRRTVALVVDDLGLSFEGAVMVREALKKFVDEQMQPGDLVAIIRTGAGMGALQQFTADKRQLYAAVERVRWNMIGRSGTGAFTPIGQDPSNFPANDSVDDLRTEIYSVGTLGALNFVVRGLRELPGRKSVILFSEGIRLFNRDERSSRVMDSLQRLTDLANRASVVIYTINARGLQPLTPTASDDLTGLRAEQIDDALNERRQVMFDTEQGLQYLAHETGGFAIKNSNDLGRGIKRVLDDQKGYYLLGYVPDQATFRLEQGRRKFHKITVKVKTAGMQVRSRKGFYGIADEQVRPARRTPAEQVVAALISPFTSGDVHLKLTSLFSHDQKNGSLVRSLLHIDPRDLTFTQKPDGSHECIIDLVAVTFSDNGRIVQQEGRTYTLNVPGLRFEHLLQRGFLYTINVPVKKAGAYQLRVAVRDSSSERVGSANQFIEVPDIGKNRLTLSGLVISGNDPAKRQSAERAAEQAASDKEGAVEDPDPLVGPSMRILRGGMEVNFGFLIYNAQRDAKTNRPDLETQVVLLKDGKRVYAGKTSPLEISEQTDVKRIPASGTLRLGADMPPGEYVVQIIVTDKLAKEKYRTATQWMDFEIK